MARHGKPASHTAGRMPVMALALFLLPSSAMSQARRYGDVSYAQPGDCSIITRLNPANPYAYLFRNHCEQSDARMKQSIARIMGRPQPSAKVLSVPAYGTADAKRYGVACMGGLVMLRIENGWQQALDGGHRYYTCRAR